MNLNLSFISKYKEGLFIFACLFLLSLLTFWKSLGFTFITDDYFLVWVSKYHQNLFKIYWSHPSTVFEFWTLVKLFGNNPIVFNIFGIFLRAASGFAGYFFIKKLTNSKLTAIIFTLFYVTSYVGLQSTTWASAHIAYIDLFLIIFSVYKFFVYLSTQRTKDFLLCLVFTALSLISDPGRDFPLVIVFLYIYLLTAVQKGLKNHLTFKRLKKLFIIFIVSILIFFSWYILFGYYFGGSVRGSHGRIPLKPLIYYFGSIGNLLITPFIRNFELSLIYPSWMKSIYPIFTILVPSLWLFTFFSFFKYKSKFYFIISILLFWILAFYFPSWISYPREYVPAIHRYLTISGFGFVALLAVISRDILRKNIIAGSILILLILSINFATVKYYLVQENSYRSSTVINKVWTKVNNQIPSGETSSLLYFKGRYPLIPYQIVYSGDNPYKLLRENNRLNELIVTTDNLEKVANQLCHKNINTLESLRKNENSIKFHAWYVWSNGNVKNITKQELLNLEKLYEKQNLCITLRKKYGDTFTVF